MGECMQVRLKIFELQGQEDPPRGLNFGLKRPLGGR